MLFNRVCARLNSSDSFNAAEATRADKNAAATGGSPAQDPVYIREQFSNTAAFVQVHLDENGSFVWPLIDGKRSITDIGVLVDEKFGEAAHPLYERLAVVFRTLDSYGFVSWFGEKTK